MFIVYGLSKDIEYYVTGIGNSSPVLYQMYTHRTQGGRTCKNGYVTITYHLVANDIPVSYNYNIYNNCVVDLMS